MNNKVLIVEDDKDIRKNIKRLLESEGYAVEVAENGQAGIDLLNLSAALPALILLDMMMPILDGVQFSALLKQNPKFANIPIAIMTADGRIDEKMIKTGANAALKKPVDIDDILNVVKKFVNS